MMTHTPGPWHYYEHETYRTTEPGISEPENSWIEIRDEGGLITATLPGGSIYDAALIAAAPDLLAALETVMPWASKAVADHYNQKQGKRALDIARAAIAKATQP